MVSASAGLPAPARRSVAAGSPGSGRRRLRRAVGPAILAARRVGAAGRVLPDFLVIGAQKAGTTTLYGQLVAHPSVLPALRKEVHFFDRPGRSLDWYRAFFPRRRRYDAIARRTGLARTGEATPYYLCHPAVPRRVRAVLPDVRLVAVLRDPVARAISGYHHAVRMGHERRPIEEALDPAAAEPLAPPRDEAWYDAPSCPLRLRGYLARGHYADQLERWFEVFPREQVLVCDLAELATGEAAGRVFAFLGLPAGTRAAVPDRNVGAYAPPTSDLERRLRDYFAPHNARLVELLGARFDWAM